MHSNRLSYFNCNILCTVNPEAQTLHVGSFSIKSLKINFYLKKSVVNVDILNTDSVIKIK